MVLRTLWSKWAQVLVSVEPETVVRWHRQGFRLFWRWKSRKGRKNGRPNVTQELRDLIKRLARENPSWGAPRIHGELLKLGFEDEVSERTVQRYMPRRPAVPGSVDRWKAFLRNHSNAIAAMDLFSVPTITFKVLHVFFVIEHGTRRILHVNVTANPTAAWFAQQLREAFPYGEVPRYLIHDNDKKFGKRVLSVIQGMGIKSKPTTYRSPWQNGLCERWILSCRNELLGHVVPLSEAHLRRLLHEYVGYYHEDRTHLGLAKQTPLGRETTPKPSATAKVESLVKTPKPHFFRLQNIDRE